MEIWVVESMKHYGYCASIVRYSYDQISYLVYIFRFDSRPIACSILTRLPWSNTLSEICTWENIFQAETSKEQQLQIHTSVWYGTCTRIMLKWRLRLLWTLCLSISSYNIVPPSTYIAGLVIILPKATAIKIPSLWFFVESIQVCFKIEAWVHWVSNDCWKLYVSTGSAIWDLRTNRYQLHSEPTWTSIAISCLGCAIDPLLNVPSPLSAFVLAGAFFFVYSAFAFSMRLCLCSNSLLIAASLFEAEIEAWW
jgi:hypothetical protein